MFRKIIFAEASLSQQPPLPLLPEEKFEPLPLLPPTVSKGYIIYISHISNLELVIYQTIYGICIKIDGSTNAKLISIASTWYLSGFFARSLRTIWFSASACSNWSMRKLSKLSYAREIRSNFQRGKKVQSVAKVWSLFIKPHWHLTHQKRILFEELSTFLCNRPLNFFLLLHLFLQVFWW